MKKIILILVTSFFILSCNTEPNMENYIVSFKNETSESISIKGYNKKNKSVFEYTIPTNQSNGEASYFSDAFIGYINKAADSIVFKFLNNKGYVCDHRPSKIEKCFNSKYIFGGRSSFREINKTTFEFVITEDDYKNAYDLP